MSVSSYESEPPHSPASITTSLTSAESVESPMVESPMVESPMSPDRAYSQDYPLPGDRRYEPDKSVPGKDEKPGFRGRKTVPVDQNPELQPQPAVDDQAPAAREGVQNPRSHRGAARPVATGDIASTG